MCTLSLEDFDDISPHMIQRVTHIRPAVTITAPMPEQQGVAYDIVSESNRQAYIEQSAKTRNGKVAEFKRY
jgi:hypothetical protein